MNTQPLEQQLYDVYGIEYVPWWHTTLFYLISRVCVALILLALIYYLVRWYRRRYCRQTPWDTALRTITALEKKYTTPDQSPLFYSALIDCIKTYLSERYTYSMAHKTDQECILFLATTDIPDEIRDRVQTLFSVATVTKFARQPVTQIHMREHSALARDFIHRTIPQRMQ